MGGRSDGPCGREIRWPGDQMGGRDQIGVRDQMGGISDRREIRWAGDQMGGRSDRREIRWAGDRIGITVEGVGDNLLEEVGIGLVLLLGLGLAIFSCSSLDCTSFHWAIDASGSKGLGSAARIAEASHWERAHIMSGRGLCVRACRVQGGCAWGHQARGCRVRLEAVDTSRHADWCAVAG